jgi:hypothetical protein
MYRGERVAAGFLAEAKAAWKKHGPAIMADWRLPPGEQPEALIRFGDPGKIR